MPLIPSVPMGWVQSKPNSILPFPRYPYDPIQEVQQSMIEDRKQKGVACQSNYTNYRIPLWSKEAKQKTQAADTKKWTKYLCNNLHIRI
jgi:hypothetical protein